MCLWSPRNEEQMAERHAVACGEEEKQHEEDKMRDIHVGKRGSEAASEEQTDKLRKTVRFVQEAPNTSSSSTMHVSNMIGRSPFLCRIQVMFTIYLQISALDAFF